MFSGIKNKWRKARGEALRVEFEDSILRLNAMGENENLEASLTLADSYKDLLERYAYKNFLEKYRSIENMPEDTLRAEAKSVLAKAKEKHPSNVGQGYGLFFLSAYIESCALPGDDALTVKMWENNLIEAAFQVSDNYNENNNNSS